MLTIAQIAMLLALVNVEETNYHEEQARLQAEDFFESYEETCLGWDGDKALAKAEALGICKYFKLQP